VNVRLPIQVFSDILQISVLGTARRATPTFQDYSALRQGFAARCRLKQSQGERCALPKAGFR
jgi:hypothetical protein